MSQSNDTELLWCVKVPIRQTQSSKQLLSSMGIFLKNYALIKEAQFTFLPINLPPDPPAEWILKKRFFKPLITKLSYQEVLKERIHPDLHQFIPSSFDRFGDLILVKLDPALNHLKTLIGQTFLDHFSVRSVFNKDSDVESEYRTIDWECIAGEDNPVTVHSMHTLRWKVNIREVYFNARLSNEYLRVAQLSQDGDQIIDMFAGIGPFTLLCASSKKVTISALDINPTAISLLKENIELNRKYIIGSVTALCGDSRILIKDLPPANKIIMNLPGYASSFLDVALPKILVQGTVFLHQFIHLSKDEKKTFRVPDASEITELVSTLTKNLNLLGYEWQIAGHKLRAVSPGKIHVVWDITRLA